LRCERNPLLRISNDHESATFGPLFYLHSRVAFPGLYTLTRHGFAFPLLLRAPGFHSGASGPGSDRHAVSGARGSDGKTRKYRVMTINGEIYPLHAAISNHWKIHYFIADMTDNPEHRAEDAAFLENTPDTLGPLAMSALHQIQSMLGLDYAGVDFGLSAKGEVLVFEANATMVINPPEPDELWNYRRPAYQRIHSAVQKMLLDRAHGSRNLQLAVSGSLAQPSQFPLPQGLPT